MDNALRARIEASFNAQTLMRTLGATLEQVSEGEIQIALQNSDGVRQQHGFIHAGAIASIVDSACGYAALTVAPLGAEVVTVEFKVNFPRPALGDRFVATGKVQSAGKLLTVCTGEVRAFSGESASSKIVALMQATICNVSGS